MKTLPYADDTVLVESYNNLGKLHNRVNYKRTEVAGWLAANELSINISKTFMLIANKHVNTESFSINANGKCIERTLTYKHLGVIVDEKLAWKEHCK